MKIKKKARNLYKNVMRKTWNNAIIWIRFRLQRPGVNKFPPYFSLRQMYTKRVLPDAKMFDGVNGLLIFNLL